MAKDIKKPSKVYLVIKRILGFILSLIGLIILFIPLLIVAIIIKLESKGPVFFTQKRIGIHKSTFKVYKFRTMRTDAPKDMPTHMLENPDAYIGKRGLPEPSARRL